MKTILAQKKENWYRQMHIKCRSKDKPPAQNTVVMTTYISVLARAAQGADPGTRWSVNQALSMLADDTRLLWDWVGLALAAVAGEIVLVVLDDLGGDVMSNDILLGGALRGRRRASD